MKLFLSLVLSVSFLGPNDSMGSALVEIRPATSEIIVWGHFHFEGVAATDLSASAAAQEVERMWNEPKTVINRDGKDYSVQFKISYQLGRSPSFLMRDQSCARNFIQILPKTNAGDRSYYQSLGSSYGVFYTSDDLGRSTTAAHEFGHGLGLDHPWDVDQTSTDVPGIMFPRGTLVCSEFQWDRTAEPGAPGGTLNPYYRRVRQIDVQALGLERIEINSNGYGCLGDGIAIPANF